MVNRSQYILAFLIVIFGSIPGKSFGDKLDPYILLDFNFHSDTYKNIQLQPKMVFELRSRGFSSIYSNELLEKYRSDNDTFPRKMSLKIGQRFFRVSLTSNPLETGYLDDEINNTICLITVQYREIKKVDISNKTNISQLKESMPTKVWPGDYVDEYPGSCQDIAFLQKLAEGLYLFNSKILRDEVRIRSYLKFNNQ